MECLFHKFHTKQDSLFNEAELSVYLVAISKSRFKISPSTIVFLLLAV